MLATMLCGTGSSFFMARVDAKLHRRGPDALDCPRCAPARGGQRICQRSKGVPNSLPHSLADWNAHAARDAGVIYLGVVASAAKFIPILLRDLVGCMAGDARL